MTTAMWVIGNFVLGWFLGAKSRRRATIATWKEEGYAAGWREMVSDIRQKVRGMSDQDKRRFLKVINGSFCSLGDDLRGSGMCCKPEFVQGDWGFGSPCPTEENGAEVIE